MEMPWICYDGLMFVVKTGQSHKIGFEDVARRPITQVLM
jgi:hypothetical protein